MSKPCERVDSHGAHDSCLGLRPMPSDIGEPAPGIGMVLTMPELTPIATCECGHRSYGDSINDAVLAWTAHVTATPDCREKL